MTRSRFCKLRYLSNILLPELVQPGRKQQNSRNAKLNKKTVETLLNVTFSLDDKENEMKMEKYAKNLEINIL